MKHLSILLACLFLMINVFAQENTLGHFNTEKDFLIANYDSKPDVDDLLSVAAFATMLRDSRFADLKYFATAGAYGTQGGTFIDAGHLFDLSFGDNWVNAHENHETAVSVLFNETSETLNHGGDIWIAEAGQSDVSADLIQKIRNELPKVDTKQRIHIVQHSFWNESVTTEEKFNYVRNYSDYTKIPDGNGSGNGTPNFRTEDGSWWSMVLEDPQVGEIWAEAQMLVQKYNIVAGYDNEAVGAGGFDFSDTVEQCWIFGFNDVNNVDAFFNEFLD